MQPEFFLRAGIALAIVFASAACSTQRHDGTTVSANVEIAIQTMPEGAKCTLDRRGQQIAVIAATPQTVSFDRSAREITLSCELDRHISTVEVIQSRYVGGPLKPTPSPIAGLVAAAIVAGSPANYDYPSQYNLRLPSNVFADAAERDAQYESLRKNVAERHETRLIKIKNECPGADVCRTNQQASEAQRDAELVQLEASKAKAEIVPPAPKAQEKPATKKPS